MKLVRPALSRYLDDAAGETTKLGADVVCRDTELLDCVLCRNQRVDVVLGHVRSHAIDEEQALSTEAAADLVVAIGDRLCLRTRLKAAATTVRKGIARGPPARYDARNEIQQVVHIAAVQR